MGGSPSIFALKTKKNPFPPVHSRNLWLSHVSQKGLKTALRPTIWRKSLNFGLTRPVLPGVRDDGYDYDPEKK